MFNSADYIVLVWLLPVTITLLLPLAIMTVTMTSRLLSAMWRTIRLSEKNYNQPVTA